MKKIIRYPHGWNKGGIFDNEYAPALTTSSWEANNFMLETDMAKKIYKIRKLTPTECFRLMKVSDEDIKKIQSAGISDSRQYMLAGNSIVVSVLEGIFTQMFRKDDSVLF